MSRLTFMLNAAVRWLNTGYRLCNLQNLTSFAPMN